MSSSKDIKNNSVVNQTFSANFSAPTAAPGAPNGTVEPRGCPLAQAWCQYTPSIHLGQYISADVLIGAGYAACNVMSYTLYSKVLWPKPQVRGRTFPSEGGRRPTILFSVL